MKSNTHGADVNIKQNQWNSNVILELLSTDISDQYKHLKTLITYGTNQFAIKGCPERSRIRPQHVNKGKVNKYILKASVDTVYCLTQI